MSDSKLLTNQIIKALLKSIPIAGSGLEELSFGTIDEIKKKELHAKMELFKKDVLNGIEKIINTQNNIVETLHLIDLQRKFYSSSYFIEKDIKQLAIPDKSTLKIEQENFETEKFNSEISTINHKLETWFKETRNSLEYILLERNELSRFSGSTYLKDYFQHVVDFLDHDKSIKSWYVTPKWYIDCNLNQCEDDYTKCRNSVKNKTLISYIHEWLSDDDKHLLVVLGDYGLGKTTLVKKLTYELSRKGQKRKGKYIPFLIQFKNYSKSINMGSLLKDFLYENNFSIDSFYSTIKNYTPVFILDGFDEVSSTISKSLNLLSLTDITKAVPKNSKIILTSRTHFFKNYEEELESLTKIGYMFNDSNIKLIKSQTKVYLEKFDSQKITLYTKKRLKKEYSSFNKRIFSIYNLPDLITRPILADLICSEWKYLTNTNSLTLYDLYTTIIDNWINREKWRNIEKSSVFVFMEIIAIKMLETKKLICNYQDIVSYINVHYNNQKILSDNIEVIDSNIRTSTFISRDIDGNYMFMHKSFWEYFAGRSIVNSLNNPNHQFDFQFWEYPYNDVITKFIGFIVNKDVLWENIIKIQPAKTKEKLNKATSLFLIYYDLGFYKINDVNLKGVYFWDHLIGRLNVSNTNLHEPMYFVDSRNK